ncbi:MAG: Gfo/Idh/MocA family oxidoreductase, partial [Verrucomicrobia bacterium]|nr:Gfo/Idh/MocA family oxidoreductase [Verrucomicrobiota bacterium]
KFPGVRDHFKEKIAAPYGLDTAIDTYPEDHIISDPSAYQQAMDQLDQGDMVILFTPDSTHFEIAMEAVKRRLHVLVAKPLVKTLEGHQVLAEAASSVGSLVCMEVHKRWDPIYTDACDRIRGLGDFSLFHAYMSQPKSQLDSFRAWAGVSSDISYYLNAHHLDFLSMSLAGRARPVLVNAMASNGVAESKKILTEDSITLTSRWQNLGSNSFGTSVCTASWIAPSSDVHSQQRFFYQGHKGEVCVDQAHRGYSIADDAHGFSSPNPLFMKYTPDSKGRFCGQQGYGYRSISDFVDAVISISKGQTKADDWNQKLATIHDTFVVTALLEAGRKSLDSGSSSICIEYGANGLPSALILQK